MGPREIKLPGMAGISRDGPTYPWASTRMTQMMGALPVLVTLLGRCQQSGPLGSPVTVHLGGRGEVNVPHDNGLGWRWAEGAAVFVTEVGTCWLN